MSKTTLRKAIKDFEAPELRELLIDVYTKSKEARELLDFFAEPDIEKKAEAYRAQLTKEATRYTRRAYNPRIAKLRATIKKFKIFESGSEAVADLMVHTMTALLSIGKDSWLRERLYVQIHNLSVRRLISLSRMSWSTILCPVYVSPSEFLRTSGCLLIR